MESFDTIVIGTGGIGGAALYHLAKKGCRVLGLDRHPHAHAFGSSHGQSRIIRQAYFEHPDYVPLLQRAYKLWRELEADSAEMLFHQTGLVEVGPVDGMLIPGVLESVRQHNLEVELLSAQEARSRFPFCIGDEMQVIVEPTGGYLLVEDCVRAHLQQAMQMGATWKQETVVEWTYADGQLTVRTDKADYHAENIVVCGGAWSAELLKELGVKLHVLEKHQYWFATKEKRADDMPVYFFETKYGEFYGFPRIGAAGLKLAQHGGGQKHDAPFDLETAEDHEDFEVVERFAKDHLDFPVGSLTSRKACMYTMSPDGHFVVDRHPEHANVLFAAGMSGHGFKFAAAIGWVLARMANGESLDLSVDFLNLKRFQR